MFSASLLGKTSLLAAAAAVPSLLVPLLLGQAQTGTEAPRPPPEASPAPRAERPVMSREITKEMRLSILRGLDYLAKNQQESGAFAGSEGFTVAVNGLVGLAFLAGGHTDKEGPYTETMRRTIKSLLSFQNPQGYFDDNESRMYGHGFATLFLAELYGMTGEHHHEVRTALKKAVGVIEGSQSKDGGWDYQPDSRFGGLGSRGESDTSITVCQAMALRAARNLGLEVRGDVVARARDYIRRAQNPDGGFCYRLSGTNRWGATSQFPRSAAGVCILFALARPEEYSSPELRRGFQYLLEHHGSFSQFPFYGHYYCTQAMFQAGGSYWASYFPQLRKKLLENQQRDGSWSSGGMEVKAQATAMALIALQVPFRFLPITER